MESALKFYQETFGLELIHGPIDDERQKVKVAFLRSDPSQPSLELVAPLGADSPVFRYLKADTSCYHICYEVDDLAADLAWLKSRKCLTVSGPFPAPAFGGRPLAWTYLPNKHLVELVEAAR